MDFEQVGKLYIFLREQYDKGMIAWPDFESRVRSMVVVAPDGKRWSIDPGTGSWVEAYQPGQVQQIKTQPAKSGSPETLIQFLTLLIKGMLKNLPMIIIIALVIALLTWAYHTYLIAKVNDGLMIYQNRFGLNSIMNLQENIYPGVIAFWGLLAYFLKSFFMKIFYMGPSRWLVHNLNTPRTIFSSISLCGKRSLGLIFIGVFIAMFLGGLYRNYMLSWVLAIGFIVILTAQFRGLEVMLVKYSITDLQRLIGQRLLKEGQELESVYLSFLGMAFGFFLAATLGTRFTATLVVSVIFLAAFVLLKFLPARQVTAMLTMAVSYIVLTDSQILAYCEGGSFTNAGGNWINWWGSDRADLVRQLGWAPAGASMVGSVVGGIAAGASAVLTSGGAAAGTAAAGVTLLIPPVPEGSITRILSDDKAIEQLLQQGSIRQNPDGSYSWVDKENALLSFPGGRGVIAEGNWDPNSPPGDPNLVDPSITIVFDSPPPTPVAPDAVSQILSGDKAIEQLIKLGSVRQNPDGTYSWIDKVNALDSFPGGRGAIAEGGWNPEGLPRDPNLVDPNIVIVIDLPPEGAQFVPPQPDLPGTPDPGAGPEPEVITPEPPDIPDEPEIIPPTEPGVEKPPKPPEPPDQPKEPPEIEEPGVQDTKVEEPPAEGTEPASEEPPAEETTPETPPAEETAPGTEETTTEETPAEEPPVGESESIPDEPSMEDMDLLGVKPTPEDQQTPVVEEPSADQTAVEETPTEQPPAEEPPLEEPPAEGTEPASEEPPAEETTPETPPAEETVPGTEETTTEETPAEEPPVGESESIPDEPSMEDMDLLGVKPTPEEQQTPVVEEPSADQTAVEETPTEQPPAEEPPVEGTEPSAEQSPAEEPPVEQPPVEEPPAEGAEPAPEAPPAEETPPEPLPTEGTGAAPEEAPPAEPPGGIVDPAMPPVPGTLNDVIDSFNTRAAEYQASLVMAGNDLENANQYINDWAPGTDPEGLQQWQNYRDNLQEYQTSLQTAIDNYTNAANNLAAADAALAPIYTQPLPDVSNVVNTSVDNVANNLGENLSNLTQENWTNLNNAQREAVVREVTEGVRDGLGMEGEAINIVFDPNPNLVNGNQILGTMDTSTNPPTMNISSHGDQWDNPDQIINTISHEIRHWQQSRADISLGDEASDNAAALNYTAENFVCPTADPVLYEHQFIERDARNFGESFADELRNRVNANQAS